MTPAETKVNRTMHTTVPASVVAKLRLEPGTVVEWVEVDGGFELRRAGVAGSLGRALLGGAAGEGVEVGCVVEEVDAFRFFEEVDDEVSHRGGGGFVAHFDQVAGDDEIADHLAIDAAPEGDGHDDDRVDQLADGGGGDGPGPEHFAAGEHLHLRHHEGVGEFAAPVSDEARHDQTREEAEDGFKCRLAGPARSGREIDDQHAETGEERGRQKTVPDGAAAAGVPIHFGEDVTEDVGDGEEDLGSGEDDVHLEAQEGDVAKRDELAGHEVGDQEHDYEEAEADFVVFEAMEWC